MKTARHRSGVGPSWGEQLAVLGSSLSWIVLFCSGCSRVIYSVELHPRGDQLQRSITVMDSSEKKEGEPQTIVPAEQKRLSEIYGGDPGKPTDEGVVFTGLFRDVMPQDVGGHGRYVRYHSPMGSLFIYSERFGGTAEITDGLKRRYDAADRLIELLADWLAVGIKDQALRSRLEPWVRTNLRKDLRGLTLYAWTLSARGTADNRDMAESWGWYPLQYFVEKRYLVPEDLPKLSRIFDQDDLHSMYAWVVDRLGKIAGLDDAGLKQLHASLGDWPAARESLRSFLRTTPEYAKLVAEGQPNADNDPLRVLVDTAAIATFPDIYGGGNCVSVSLHLDANIGEPISTNGNWNEERRTIHWSESLGEMNVLPGLAAATWSQPDQAYQMKHFGGVLLHGEDLGKYVTWYCGLDKDEQMQWDEFVQSLSPTSDHVLELERFQEATAASIFRSPDDGSVLHQFRESLANRGE